MILEPNRDRFVWRRLSDGGAFVVELQSGNHWVLNRTAADFLDCLGAGADYHVAKRRLGEKYAVDDRELDADLRALSRDLADLGVLRVEENG